MAPKQEKHSQTSDMNEKRQIGMWWLKLWVRQASRKNCLTKHMRQNMLLASGQEQSAGRYFDPTILIPTSVKVICKHQAGTQSLEAKVNGE